MAGITIPELERTSSRIDLSHGGRFPVSPRRSNSTKQRSYKIIPVFPEPSERLELKDTTTSLKEMTETAWAIFLRTYLQSDTVSFALLSDFRDDDNVHDLPKYDTSESQTVEVTALQYEINPENRLIDLNPIFRGNSTIQQIERFQVNTAIYFRSSSRRGAGTHAGLQSEEHCQGSAIRIGGLNDVVRMVPYT